MALLPRGSPNYPNVSNTPLPLPNWLTYNFPFLPSLSPNTTDNGRLIQSSRLDSAKEGVFLGNPNQMVSYDDTLAASSLEDNLWSGKQRIFLVEDLGLQPRASLRSPRIQEKG
ncbi:hypothetical protein PZA11_007445 [Diplocarpon coronariae]